MLRRQFLQGLVAAPAVILTPGLLMAVKPFEEELPFMRYVYIPLLISRPEGLFVYVDGKMEAYDPNKDYRPIRRLVKLEDFRR